MAEEEVLENTENTETQEETQEPEAAPVSQEDFDKLQSQFTQAMQDNSRQKSINETLTEQMRMMMTTQQAPVAAQASTYDPDDLPTNSQVQEMLKGELTKVQTQFYQQQKMTQFYSSNPDIGKYPKIAELVLSEVAAENPYATDDDLLSLTKDRMRQNYSGLFVPEPNAPASAEKKAAASGLSGGSTNAPTPKETEEKPMTDQDYYDMVMAKKASHGF